MTTTSRRRSTMGALYAGLGLTVVALIVPYVDQATANVLADHIQAGYPSYSQARTASAATIYLVYLSVVEAVGVVCWLATIWAVRTGRRWTRVAATGIFALGTSIALFDLLVKDTSGDTGLPSLLGWVGMLPSLAGLLAVVLLWRRPSPSHRPER